MTSPQNKLPSKIPFTADAYRKMLQDVEKLTQERAEVMKRLQVAREMGDLSENGAYIYAKFELGSVNRQLGRLRHLIEQGEIVAKPQSSSTVRFGSVVTLSQNGKEVTYTMVSIHESSLTDRKLSTASPIGQAVMGKKVGDVVHVQTPVGETTLTILDLE